MRSASPLQRPTLTASSLWLATAWLSCAEAPPGRAPAEPSGRIRAAVGPLGFDDLTNAKYSLTLKNEDGDVVWANSDLESDNFGNGSGDLAYVGSCDLSAPNGTFELVLDSLYTGNPPTLLDPADYENPCPAHNPCIKEAICSEDEMHITEFQLVIVIKAEKGFFDIAIRISDIFCSATLSCKEQLLFVNGTRRKTHILGLACTAGLGSNTRLYMQNLVLECPGFDAIWLDPGGSKGNQEPFAPLGAWAIYRDNEEFEGYRKGFWNLAFAFEEGTPSCHLTARMTAAEGPLIERSTPLGTKYPVIEVGLDLGAQSAVCHPTFLLDGGNPHIATRYTDFDESICFEHEADIRTTGLKVYGGVCPASP
jgi:hypothetical protein